MLVEILKSKIHRAVVTDKNLEYEGSIMIDEALMNAAGICVNEKVHVLNLNNGTRLETYVIRGRKGSGDVCVNGAAARMAERGDRVIIVSYGFVDAKEAIGIKPKVVKVNEKNKIIKK
jgi:aspartate 1-decarboxylase